MKVLIVGGTIYLGRHLVAAAAVGGHDVTVFHRGRHAPVPNPAVEVLRGDRHRDVSVLRGRYWDAVIDTCGYVPSAVDRIMDALDRSRTGHYTFVSSVSVYAEFPAAGIDERGDVARITPEQVSHAEALAAGDRATAETYQHTYGPLKALCEQVAEAAMPRKVLNVRPGLIVGPHDYTDRLTYWVRRVAGGGNVLAPGRPERRVRVVDVRDLSEWILSMAERRQAGVFNATGAEDGLTMSGLLDACHAAAGGAARVIWTDEAFLLRQGVAPWRDLPLWLPAAANGIFEVRNDKAVAAGLRFRPLAETIASTLAWDRARDQNESLRAGLSRERERQLLDDAAHSSH